MVVLIILGTHRVCRQPWLSLSQALCANRLCSHPALLPDVGHVWSVPDTVPVHTPNHPEALTHLWVQKTHTCFCHPRHGPGPKLPKHCITLTSACKSSVWRAGYGSLDRHSQGRLQGYKGLQVGSVRHQEWTAVHTVPWTATEPTDSVQLSKHTQSLLTVPFQGIWKLGHSWLQLV